MKLAWGLAAAALAVGARAALPPGTAADVIAIPGQGSISGVRDNANNTRYWLSVPFAADAGGENRFLAPKPRAPWTGVLDATEYGPGCPSLHHNADVPTNTKEDCLNADIFAPVNASKAPVVVWFYGGGFAEGSNSGPFRLYDGAYMASRHGVVVVQPNYRLGALGWARFKGTSATGNAGLLDQDFMLRWVQRNIALFGGDPAQVTIMGESAGAMSVGIHLTRPGSRGLFHRAVMESNFAGYVYRNSSGADDFGQTMCTDVPGCMTGDSCSLSCLQAANLTDVTKAWKKASGDIIDSILSDFNHLIDAVLAYTPIVDGEVITELPLAAIAAGSPNYQSDIPVLIGTNGFEGQTFVYAATKDVLPSWLLPLVYPVVLGGEDNAKQILARERYAVATSDDAKVQLSNIVTDAWFRCASELFVDSAQAPAFVYRYNHTFSHSEVFGEFGLPTICEKVACHASELPFVWHNDVPSLNATFSPAERVLTTQMDAYWASFITTGDPNELRAAGAPEWPRWSPQDAINVRFDTPRPQNETSKELCAFWKSLPGFGFF